MYACDFEYDGRLLSNFGFMICEFNGSGELTTPDGGHQIVFNKVRRNGGRKYSLTDTKYEECVQAQFQICKNSDLSDDLSISKNEYREVVRWLNRHEFLKFRIIDEDHFGSPQCYYNASFNIKKIMVNDMLYGLELSMETDSPFGYGAPFEKTWDVTAGSSIQFEDLSDEIGIIRPKITIVCKASGDLTITNESLGSVMKISNCEVDETINIDGDTQIITTSLSTHKIYNDFNYEFLCIGNGYDDRVNEISFSQPCIFTIKYNPVIKEIP